MKLSTISQLPRLSFIVNAIKQIENHFSSIMKEKKELKLNPDQTAGAENAEAKAMIFAATISMVGNHYATNNAAAIEEFVDSVMVGIPE